MLHSRKIPVLKFCAFSDIFNAVYNSMQSIFQYQLPDIVFDSYLKHSDKRSEPRRRNGKYEIKFLLTCANGKILGMFNEQNKSTTLFFKKFLTQ